MRLLPLVIALFLCLNAKAQVFDIYSSEIERVDIAYYKESKKEIVIETDFEIHEAREYYLLVLNTSKGMAETKVNRVKRYKGKTILYFKPRKMFLEDYLNENNYLILSHKTED